MSEKPEISARIEQKAIELGFSACGFSPSVALKDLGPDYQEWLSRGNAGEMNYLARNIEVRLDPGKLVEGAKTVISLAVGYYPVALHIPGNPRISRYATGQDYHNVLRSRGKELLSWIRREIAPVNGRVFMDSAPIFEREWARRAGMGWIGKNGCLIIPRFGSWFFLAEVVIDLDVPAESSPTDNHCGNCSRCIEACPTGALAGDGSMDPRKCISYLTIEHRSDIPGEYRGKWNDWIFGCDICQEVCPWNQKPGKSLIEEFRPRPELNPPDRHLFRDLDEEKFNSVFAGTPVVRAGRKQILRNFEFLEPFGSGSDLIL